MKLKLIKKTGFCPIEECWLSLLFPYLFDSGQHDQLIYVWWFYIRDMLTIVCLLGVERWSFVFTLWCAYFPWLLHNQSCPFDCNLNYQNYHIWNNLEHLHPSSLKEMISPYLNAELVVLSSRSSHDILFSLVLPVCYLTFLMKGELYEDSSLTQLLLSWFKKRWSQSIHKFCWDHWYYL